MKKLLIIAAIALIALNCKSQESAIKKDLNTRFTGFEIVEIKPDKANVFEAKNFINKLEYDISTANLSISLAASRFDANIWTFEKTTQFMDSVSNSMADKCKYLNKLELSEAEPVYFVAYRIYKEELKIEKFEYYYFHKKSDGKTELLHRPCRWDYYLQEIGCSDIMDQCYKEELKFLKSFNK